MPQYGMNKRLFDAILANHKGTLGVERFIRNEVLKLLGGLKKEIVRELVESGIDGTTRTDWRWARLWKFLDAANEAIDETYSDIAAYTHDATKNLVEISTADLVHRINESGDREKDKAQLFPIKWTDEALDRIAGDTLIHGSKAADWWARQSRGFQEGMGDQLKIGMGKGESIPDLVKRIFPNAVHLAEAQKEGRAQRDIIGTARRNAEALVRTSTLTVMREASMDVYAANADVVKGVQWCSTLDERTTPLCQRLDGKVWLLPDYEPDGHSEPFPGMSAHWNCRSAILPEMKSWEDLAREAGGDTEWARKMDRLQEDGSEELKIGKAERASADGEVDARLSYEEWAKGKEPKRKIDDYFYGITREVKADVGEYWKNEGRPTKMTYGDLPELIKREAAKRPWESITDDLLESTKGKIGTCLFLNDKDGNLEPVAVIIDKNFVLRRYNGEPIRDKSGNEVYGNDGYSYYTQKMPPDFQVKMTLCHEIAHNILGFDHDGLDAEGHGTPHQALIRMLMGLIYPNFARLPYRPC